MDFIGIDFGSKLAGTTAICYAQSGLHFLQSVKGRDADVFVEEFIANHGPRKVFLDAPLSLPLAFCKAGGGDFFYRKCDRLTKAMSPMFLGGLTARAMRLKHHLEKSGVQFFESYPRGLVDELAKDFPDMAADYKVDLQKFTGKLISVFDLTLKMQPENWHQADALLAYCVGIRHSKNKSLIIGDRSEGLIYI